MASTNYKFVAALLIVLFFWKFSGIRPHQHHVLSSTQNEQVNTRGTIWFYQISSFICFSWFYFICMWGKHYKPKFSTQSKGEGSPEWSFSKFAFLYFLFKRRNYVSFNLNIVVRLHLIPSINAYTNNLINFVTKVDHSSSL
jgi:hypothetical protein